MPPVLKTASLALAISAVVAACATTTSPTGRTQVVGGVSQEELNQLGTQAFNEVKAQKRPTTDARQQREAQCIVAAITQQLPPNWQGGWETVVFQDDEPNAFALPGGKVGVYTGIFRVAKNQNQLAGVISHEIGHVISRHHEERITRQMGAQGAVQVLGALLGSRYGQGIGDVAMQGGSVLAQTGFLLPGSREQESEADVVGQQLMAQAGFDPRGAVDLWTNMIAASNGSRPPQWLSTHPNPESRIRELQQRAASLVPVYEQARAAGRRPACG